MVLSHLFTLLSSGGEGVPRRKFRKCNYKVQVPLRTANHAPSDFCEIEGSAPLSL